MAEAPLIPEARLLRYECPENRSLMPRRGRGHFCAACDKEVVDMARLTLAEAVDAVREAPPRTCSSYALQGGALAFRAARSRGGTVVISVAAFLAACQSNAPSHEAAEAALRVAPSASPSASASVSPFASVVSPLASAAPLAPEAAASTPPTPPGSAACQAKPAPSGRASARVGTPQKPRADVLTGY